MRKERKPLVSRETLVERRLYKFAPAAVRKATLHARGATITLALGESGWRVEAPVEWPADPGGREWITEKTRAGFVIVLPAAPRRPVRVHWVARGL